MAKLKTKADCGNSPRKKFLNDFYFSVSKADTEFAKQHLGDQFEWNRIGQFHSSGKEQFSQAFSEHPFAKAEQISIETIITHGRDASVNGEIHTNDGKTYAFCDIFKFQGAGGTTIHSISSYLILNKEQPKSLNH